jgi:tetratricopeptide (TPR) repeat protein
MVVATGSQESASWIFGGLTLLFLVGAFCFGPERLPEWKRQLLAVVCAAFAGLFGFFFTGAMTLKLESEILDYSRIAVQAVGGFALFVFVLCWWVWQDKRGKRRNRNQDFDHGPVVLRTIELAEAKGRAEEQIERLKDDLAKAIERIKKLKAEGNQPDAERVLEELDVSGDMKHLQELLVKEKNEHRDTLIQRNREIAAVAYLRGDTDIALEVVTEILGELPDDLFALNQRGRIHGMLGNLEKAESDYQRVLELASETGDDPALATALGNLGLIHQARDELDEAEGMHLKSLEIAEKLGLQQIVASQCGNLGLVYIGKNKLDEAKEMHLRSLEINKKIGRLEGQAIQYGNLGTIYSRQGDQDGAEGLHLKSLEISEKLGLRDIAASNYANLGLIYKGQGRIDKGREYWEKALDLYRQTGTSHMAEKVEQWIATFDK